MPNGGSQLTAERVTEAGEGTAVRHVDQLSVATRRGLQALAGGECRPVGGLEPDEVVVTAAGYLRVARTETAGQGETRRAQV